MPAPSTNADAINTSAYHSSTNGGVERVNHTMALMLAISGNNQQTDWDIQLSFVKSAYNSSMSAATDLAPNEVHLRPLPRSPLTVFDFFNVGGHQGLDQDHLSYIDLATARQQRAYLAVREQHKITIWRLDRRNSPILSALRQSPPFSVGGWAWVYNSHQLSAKVPRRAPTPLS